MSDITINILNQGKPPLPNLTTYRDGGSTGFRLEDNNYLLENGMHNRDTLYGAPYVLITGGRREITQQEADRLREVMPNWISHLTANPDKHGYKVNSLRACLTRLENFSTIYTVPMGPIL